MTGCCSPGQLLYSLQALRYASLQHCLFDSLAMLKLATSKGPVEHRYLQETCPRQEQQHETRHLSSVVRGSAIVST